MNWQSGRLLVVCLLGVVACMTPIATNELAKADQDATIESERIYFLKKCGGAGCPYTASWLIHLDLFRRLTWWLDVTKMEAASFNVFDKAKFKFQLSDPDAYFVHHMSMYEHFLHKKVGFSIAFNKTIELSRAAFSGECGASAPSAARNYVALVPFYGGLPPNVTKDLSVKSIGQGNSLVDTSTKALQATATLCSCLKYFGRAVVGVARNEDRTIMTEMISRLSDDQQKQVILVQFKMHRPANLPFHMIAWGQDFVKYHNCLNGDGSQPICSPGSFPSPRGGPINVTYRSHDHFPDAGTNMISHVYFTECDQIVRFDTQQTLVAISAASNETTFFTGRRKEKQPDSSPTDYMSGLSIWRECGAPGYSLTWPKSHFVMHDTN